MNGFRRQTEELSMPTAEYGITANTIQDNPSADVVMQQLVAAIKSGCALDIDADAEAAFLQRYTPSFAAKLELIPWKKAEKNVMAAGRQHGILAQSIATLRKLDHVDRDVLLTAGLIVQENCRLIFRESIFCWGPKGEIDAPPKEG
jgi:hypothetical protein